MRYLQKLDCILLMPTFNVTTTETSGTWGYKLRPNKTLAKSFVRLLPLSSLSLCLHVHLTSCKSFTRSVYNTPGQQLKQTLSEAERLGLIN